MRIRPHLATLIKTAICLAALAWVVRGVAIDEVLATWSGANARLLAAGVAVFLATPVLQGVRLRRLLAAQGIAIGTGESIRLAFAGNFMNFAVPFGSTTGDVYKAAWLARRSDRRWEAMATTFVDRGIGFVTLLVTVTGIAWAGGAQGLLAPLRGWLAVLCGGLLLVPVAVRFLPEDGAEARPWMRRLPARGLLARAAGAARQSLPTPRVLGLAIIDTLGIQIAAAASFLLAALALGFRLVPHDYPGLYACFSAGEIIRALPGPPQGLGTLEAAYGLFFRAWATPSQILGAAIAIRGINLLCAVPGAAIAAGIPRLSRRHVAAGTAARRAAPAAVSAVPGAARLSLSAFPITHRRQS